MTNRPLLTLAACALLALVIGTAAWLAWPTGRSFSYVNDTRVVYRLSKDPDFASLRSGERPKAVQYDVMGTIQALQNHFQGRAWVYSAPVSSMQDNLALGSKRVSNIGFVSSIGFYREARGLTLLAGREGRVNAPEIVVTKGVARGLASPPERLLGQTVTRNPDISAERLTVTGIVAPSPWRSPDDPDEGGYVRVDPGQPGLSELDLSHYRIFTPAIQVVFGRPSTPQDVAWLREYARTRLPELDLVPPRTGGQTPQGADLLARVQQRAQALPALALLLTASGLLSLCALTLAGLLRRRALLGVDLALGARRSRLLVWELGRLLVPAIPGALLGAALVFLLPRVLPGVVLGWPPLGVLALAALIPPLTLAVLTLLLGAGVLRDTPMNLLRGARPGQFVWPLLLTLGVAFTLALGGVFSALGVHEKLQAQATRVKTEFGRVLEVSTTGNSDSRRGESLGTTTRRLDAEDADWLGRQPGVAAISIGERINGHLTVGEKTFFVNRMVTGDPALLDVLNIKLTAGQPGGCLLNTASAQEYGARVGDTVRLPGRGSTLLACRVSGLYPPPDPLKRFVMSSYPEMIVPSELGLPAQQGPLPGQEGKVADDPDGPLRTTTLLLRVTGEPTPDRLGRLNAALQEREPGLAFQLRPYTPDIRSLLARLRQQGTLFLALAATAGVVSLFGLLGGFLAYLDATRYRTALDRAQGMPLARLARGWTLGGLALGLSSALGGLLIAVRLTPALYNAFSLDAPTTLGQELLPAAAPTLPGPLTLLLMGLGITLLGAAVQTIGRVWLQRQALGELLKAGS